MKELRVPPHDLDAERTVLGIILIDNDKIHNVIDILSQKHFYNRSNGLIYNAMLNMMLSSNPIDFLTLKNGIEKLGRLEDIGGIPYIAKLADDIVSTENIQIYAEIVKDKAVLRDLITFSVDVGNSAYSPEGDGEEIIGFAHSKLIGMQFGEKRDIKLVGNEIEGVADNLLKIATDGERYGGLRTGMPALDEKIGGFQPQEYVVVAGRPGMGKTSFMLTIMAHVAITKGKKVVFFSLEQSHRAIQGRMISGQSKVDGRVFRVGTKNAKEIMAIRQASSVLSEAEIWINDNSLNIDEICSQLIKYKAIKGMDVALVDYLQLIDPGKNRGNENEQLTYISRKLKNVAKELDIPLIVASQLNRSSEKRSNSEPRLTDLRGSGSIEQDLDIGIFLYNPDLDTKEDNDYNSDKMKGSYDMDVIVGKNREGPTGKVKMRFNRKLTLYEEIYDNGVRAEVKY